MPSPPRRSRPPRRRPPTARGRASEHLLDSEPCDLEAGEELERVGRARRFRSSDKTSEIWRFSRDDERSAKRLLDLGAARVGGFSRGAIDDEGVWLVRRAIASARGDRGTRPWREVLGIVHALAEALHACES